MTEGIDDAGVARLAEIDAALAGLKVRFVADEIGVDGLAEAARPLLAERATLVPSPGEIPADEPPDDPSDDDPPDPWDGSIATAPDEFPAPSAIPHEHPVTRFVRALSAFCDAYLTRGDRRA